MKTKVESLTYELSHSIETLREWARRFREEGRGNECRFGGHHEVNGAANAIEVVLGAIEFGYMDMDGTLHERSENCFCNPNVCVACGVGHLHHQGVYGGLASACDNRECENG